jgi:hydroxypyruvate reductase
MTQARVLAAWRAALGAVDPGGGVERVLAEELTVGDWLPARDGELCVVGFGKAAVPMVGTAVDCVARAGDQASVRGVLVAPDDGSSMARMPDEIECFQGGHPLPNAGSLLAGRQVRQLVDGLGPTDRVLVLASGGGSAMMASPVAGVAPKELRATTRMLLRAGVDIESVNAIRKHISRVKGGRLARAIAPAEWQTLALSDVVGDPPHAIASGPTVADPSSFRDALRVLRDLDSEHGDHEVAAPASVVQWLRAGAAGRRAETPWRFAFERDQHRFHLTGSLRHAVDAAGASLTQEGVRIADRRTMVEGEAREVGESLADRLIETVSGGRLAQPTAVLWGGEATVDTRRVGSEVGGVEIGSGGPCQEVALAAGLRLAGRQRLHDDYAWTVAALSTDGIDGPTDAAGGVVTASFPAEHGRQACLDALDRHDAYSLLEAENALVKTGPTGTNVNDLYVGLIEPT